VSRAKVDLSSMAIPRARKGEAAPVAEAPPRPAFLDRARSDEAPEENRPAPPPAAPADPDTATPQAPLRAAQLNGAGEGAVAPAATHEVAAEEVAGEVVGHSLMPRKARSRGEPRSPITTRLTYSQQDRLFRAATLTGKTQQMIIEEALEGYLKKLKV
jgi:hypothetical protein